MRLGERPRDLAGAIDEELRHRADGAVLERNHRDRERRDRQRDRQSFEREALLVEVQQAVAEMADEAAASTSWNRRCASVVVSATRGMARLSARNASVIREPTAEGAMHQASSTRSASASRRRAANRLFAPGDHPQAVLEENRHLELAADRGADERQQRELDPALGKLAVEQGRAVRLHHAEIDPRIAAPQPLHDRALQSGEQGLGAADAQFSRRRVGHELDLVDAGAQVVEDRDAAPQQGTAVRGRLDALRAAVEQAHAEHIFEIGHHLGDDRLRDREVLRRLRHAAPVGHRADDLEVLQLDPLADKVGLHRHPPIPRSYSLIAK